MSTTDKTSNPSEPDLTFPETKTRPSPSDRFAMELRGFGLFGILAILAIILSGNVFLGKWLVPLGAILMLLWVRLSHTSWREIGYVRPNNWVGSLAIGIFLGIAFKFFMKALVMPVFGADPINPSYHYLAGNEAMLPAAIWAMLMAGFGEETVYRGWMFERLEKLFGNGRRAKTWIVIITSVLFGLSHYANQGLAGVEHATVFGIVFGSIFAVTGRIFMLMVAHAVFDLTALAFIYWDLEYEVAHLIFK